MCGHLSLIRHGSGRNDLEHVILGYEKYKKDRMEMMRGILTEMGCEINVVLESTNELPLQSEKPLVTCDIKIKIVADKPTTNSNTPAEKEENKC